MKFQRLLACLTASLIQCLAQTTGDHDATFSVDAGNYKQMSILPNGKILILGSFSRIGGASLNGIARLDSSGFVDLGFDPGEAPATGTRQFLNGFVMQSNGRILVFGDFATFGAEVRHRIVRLQSTGAVDSTFNPPLDSLAYKAGGIDHVSLSHDQGTVYVAGLLPQSTYGNALLARLKSDGTLDSTFAATEALRDLGQIGALCVDNSGNVVVAGRNPTLKLWELRRIQPDGSRDSTLKASYLDDASEAVRVLFVQPDDRILVGGAFSSFNNSPSKYLVRLTANGSVDRTLNLGKGFDGHYVFGQGVFSLSVQSDHRILVGGGYDNFDSASVKPLLRLFEDGRLDSSFHPQLASSFAPVVSVEADAEGRVISVQASSGGPEKPTRWYAEPAKIVPDLDVNAADVRMVFHCVAGQRFKLDFSESITTTWQTLIETNPVTSANFSFHRSVFENPRGFFRLASE
jgi:uncharacterized delta-60 repeat protein